MRLRSSVARSGVRNSGPIVDTCKVLDCAPHSARTVKRYLHVGLFGAFASHGNGLGTIYPLVLTHKSSCKALLVRGFVRRRPSLILRCNLCGLAIMRIARRLTSITRELICDTPRIERSGADGCYFAPRQYRTPSWVPMTSRFSAMAGEALMGEAVSKVQRTSPEETSRA